MNILMVSDVYFPRVNGVSTSIRTFRDELRAAGEQVTLIAPGYGSEAREPGVIRVPAHTVPLDPEDRLMQRSVALRLTDRLRDEAYDLVHIQTPFAAHYVGIELARRLQLPCVATYHTFFEEYLFHYVRFLPRSWLRALARNYSRDQCNALDAVIVPSTAMHDVLLRYGVHTPMHVLPTGIPLRRFRGGDGLAFRAWHGIAPHRPLALYVGRVAGEKNIGFLLHAVRRALQDVPELLLVVSGDGPALGSLQRNAFQLGVQDSVLFIGYLDRDMELPHCYAAADAFVFASQTETQGLVLLEAMAAGVPVVALSVMGTRDILRAGRGALVAPDDPAEFAAQLAALLRDALLRERLAVEARAYAEEWEDRKLAFRLRSLYADVIATAACPTSGTTHAGARI
jgi:glycosyltransferase involved in cell wall biosynthesis